MMMVPAQRIARIGAFIICAFIAGALAPTFAPRQSGARAARTTYYVSPSGSDTNDGTVHDTPLRTIQLAVDRARPGDVIELAAGVYFQDIVSKRSGTATSPIMIRGSSGAIVKGGGASRIVEINHDYLTLEGWMIDGLWGSPSSQDGFREKLLYVIGRRPNDGVTGLKVLHMTLKNAGGECLRLRYFAHENEVAYSSFVGCGMHDFKFRTGKRNGEAIYVGTAPEQRGTGENPTADADHSDDNWIHHNMFDTRGNECVDIKEASSGNIVEYNTCTGQQDPNSAGFDARGSGNIFRYNESFGNVGAGIRLGGDKKKDGIDNQVYANNIHDNLAGGIKILRESQTVCGNTLRDNKLGDVVGPGGIQTNPAKPCDNASLLVDPKSKR